MKSPVGFLRLWLALTLTAAFTSVASPKPDYGRIELIRDTWGIPHVFSTTDAGAMYGLGYATAEERGFQMTYSLRIIQGRLAEIVGERQRGNRNETAVDHDRKMRTFGWARSAGRTAVNLDRGTRQLLEAYCEGVNDSFAAQRADGRLHPLFEELGVAPEPWTPADCLLSWWHLAQFFATDGTRDLMVSRNRTTPRPGQPQPPKPDPLWLDDAASVVRRHDVSDDWVKRVEQFAIEHGLNRGDSGGETPKFSHAWVVGGKKTTTGAAVLVSDPQTPVRNPSLWMEFHVGGETFNARGIGVPGSPGLLVGFNRHIAWGLTALGADQADLFKLETDSQRPNEYRWDGEWRKMEVRRERIKVKDGSDVEITLRETHLGPVASEFCFRQSGDPEVALKRVPFCEPNRDTIQGVFAMMRATNATTFAHALGDWRFPSANCVYGDSAGQIGFAVLGAIPIRSKSAPDLNGNEAMPGTRDADDWQGFAPQELLPHVVNPKAGLLFSANHRPIASFYPLSLGISTGSMGDTMRSWRLRERLSGQEKFTPEDVLKVHYDTVNPARREIVRLGLHLRDTKQGNLSPAATNALAVLEPWFKTGASSDLKSDGAELATRISTFFRFVTTPLALKYGGGESGLARFLKDSARRMAADPKATFDEDTCQFIDTILADAWRDGGSTAGRSGRGQGGRTAATLGWFDSLDGFGSLDRARDLSQPGITVLDGQTIHSQGGQSYTQFVPMHDVDASQTICPIGHSDRPDSRYRTSTRKLWGEAKLHPAPVSREAVEKLAATKIVLSK
ncbi:MAG: penicillin acylase family protein [Verrucomicrobia bacterium]|nr:penicillin acylase family protein [Verrucomicrobiota bacterium]